jgi:hypothetical protein
MFDPKNSATNDLAAASPTRLVPGGKFSFLLDELKSLSPI